MLHEGALGFRRDVARVLDEMRGKEDRIAVPRLFQVVPKWVHDEDIRIEVN
jgi:hypothetical protein